MPDQPLGREQIEALVHEVARELGDDGAPHTVILVGGSLLAWHHLRESTVDVDTIRRLAPELAHAVEVVAARHGLAPRWMNDHAAAFAPQTFDESSCEVLLETSRLQVLGMRLRDAFLMKLFAGRARDHDDLVSLWPRTGFASAREAVEAMYDAYPAAPRDEYLEAFVADIAAEATS
ncbi:MAG TPA: DUF6036 family nucleotidyltransferase [Mycobacteriales bacterium]|nr:DUF6036 family nucleotidyltransferase [Mycobacteriales bacterium]